VDPPDRRRRTGEWAFSPRLRHQQDVTAEKKAQETVRSLQAQLIHLSRKSAMGTMAATLAHELNQPLAAIVNFAAGTRRALENPEPSREFLESGLDGDREKAS